MQEAQSWTESLQWLLDAKHPGVRYLALRDLAGLADDDPELVAARRTAHRQGPIATILDAMEEEGFWVQPGAGYAPKYRGTVWSVITLAQLGASPAIDPRIATACNYVLAHTMTPLGQFGSQGTPGTTVDCLQGNLCAALLDLGCDPARLETAFEWMARTTTGEGLASASERGAEYRYYAGQCGPLFACGANNKLGCAWGATKVLLAFGRWPVERRTPLMAQAIEQGVEWLLGVDPATAAYPSGYSDKPSGNWWKFGFPLFYVTDLLQLVEALVALGHGTDPRLANALRMIRCKMDDQGRWSLDYHYTGKTWVDWGPKRKPSPWVTLRALRVLKAVAVAADQSKTLST